PGGEIPPAVIYTPNLIHRWTAARYFSSFAVRNLCVNDSRRNNLMKQFSTTLPGRKAFVTIFLLAVVSATGIAVLTQNKQEPGPFPPPKEEPPIITPGKTNTDPPSDAIVLFDGRDLSKWRGGDGGEAKWKVQDGYMEVMPKTGSITTREGFGDC